MAAQQLAPLLGLAPALGIEVALGPAVLQLEARRIARARRIGIAQQQGGLAAAQRRPGVILGFGQGRQAAQGQQGAHPGA